MLDIQLYGENGESGRSLTRCPRRIVDGSLRGYYLRRREFFMDDQQVLRWFHAERAEKLVRKMEKRGFSAQYAETGESARKAVLSLIPEGATVALAGSQTLEQIGVKPYLRENRDKYKLIDPYEPGIDRQEGLARRKQGMIADVMVAGTNAVTEDGVLLNIDGIGNRVAGMMFGPDKVILAIGMNKVAGNLHDAWHRARQIAAPMNNKRYELANPCTETGFCQDCKSPTRICNFFTRIERSMIPDRILVVLIGETLGY